MVRVRRGIEGRKGEGLPSRPPRDRRKREATSGTTLANFFAEIKTQVATKNSSVQPKATCIPLYFVMFLEQSFFAMYILPFCIHTCVAETLSRCLIPASMVDST